jgi:hypothetical protein
MILGPTGMGLWLPVAAAGVSDNRRVLEGPEVTAVLAAHWALGLLAASLVLALIVPRAWRVAPVAWVRRVVAHPLGAPALVGGVALAAAGLHGVLAFPAPSVPDEFSNLLLADTLAHGRLANPTPPLWRHYETIAQLFEPTYASKYPPAQGMVLAVGQVVFGHPWLGVWFSIGLAMAAVAAMLRHWVGPRPAVLVGLALALHPSIMSFQDYFHARVNYSWAHSYFGGAVPLAGGALILYAVARRETRLPESLALAGGLAVLALSRPLEGLVFAVPAALLFTVDAWRGRPSTLRVFAPVAGVLGPVFVFLGVYHHAITGSPFRFPHRVHAAQYSAAAMFVFMEPSPFPEYGNVRIKRFYKKYQRRAFMEAKADLIGSRAAILGKMGTYWATPAVVGGIGLFGTRRAQWKRLWLPIVQVVTSVLLGLSVMEWHPHYSAPALPAAALLLASGVGPLLGGLKRWGRWVVGGAFVPSMLLLALSLAPTVPSDWPQRRLDFQADLEARGGKHLVLVDGRAPFKFWVNNGADLQNAPVVWAWSMSTDDALAATYRDRTIWRLDGDRPGSTPIQVRKPLQHQAVEP